MSELNIDWVRGFVLDFDLENGLSSSYPATERKLSQMRTMFRDVAAVDETLKKGDPVLYRFYNLPVPENTEHLAFGVSIVCPGKVGEEYYMTKGHFHTPLETAEVYYCTGGEGVMLLESPEGDTLCHEMKKGVAVYVPPRYAHRTINTGGEALRSFYVFRADAGHDYGTIEEKGFRKLVVERGGNPTVIDNPRWGGARAGIEEA